MKIKITKDGLFMIERAGKLKLQICPFNEHIGDRCGDWCPMFSEPFFFKSRKKDMVQLTLCQTSFILNGKDFADEREK